MIQLDVSRLPAPEPLLIILKSAAALSEDEILHVIHRADPCKLKNFLDSDVFAAETVKISEDEFEIFIWHKKSTQAFELVQKAVVNLRNRKN